MALIKSEKNFPGSGHNNKETPEDSHSTIILDLQSRNFIWPSDYKTVAIVGDSYSQELTFEVDNEYDGVPLDGTSCILSYWTSWTDESGNHSRGDINLGNPEQKEGSNKLLYKWVLNRNQTYKPGICYFSLGFYLNLNDEFYYDNSDVGAINFSTTEGKVSLVWEDGTREEIDAYYALKSNSGFFPIIDNGIKNGTIELNFDNIYDRVYKIENNLKIESFSDINNMG